MQCKQINISYELCTQDFAIAETWLNDIILIEKFYLTILLSTIKIALLMVVELF